jgi:toxin ParE1/3/4
VIHKVKFSRKSQADLASIYDYIAGQSDPSRALAYFERIRDFCLTLSHVPERGTAWYHVSRGVRVVGFERRISIAFRIEARTVTIVRVLYGGRDIPKNLKSSRKSR